MPQFKIEMSLYFFIKYIDAIHVPKYYFSKLFSETVMTTPFLAYLPHCLVRIVSRNESREDSCVSLAES